MKRYFILCFVLLACFASTSLAQIKLNNPLAHKEPVLQIPMVHITPVSSLFVPVHINTIKPFVVSLNPIVFGKREESAACLRFKGLKSTLVLNAERENDVTANLSWQTKYAFYATGFIVERSFGDSLHFSTVKFSRASTGTSFKKNYHLPDYNDYGGLTFYRIRQRNGDTGFIYSNIVSIKGLEAVPFKIYPVPATNTVTIKITPKQSGSLAITVYDLDGKIIHQQYTTCTQNSTAEKRIDVSKFAPGLYQVRVLMPGNTLLSGKFIKQ